MRTAILLMLSVTTVGCSVRRSEGAVKEGPQGNCPLTPGEREFVKWNPGHYISPIGKNRATYVDTFLKDYRTVATVKGMQKGYFWREIEPSENNYDWSAIDADIAKLSAAQKKLALVINYKYQMKDNQSSLPDYILKFPNEAADNQNVPAFLELGKPGDGLYNKGHHANFGHSRTRARLKTLLTALSARYDANPTVASVTFIETSISAEVSPAESRLFLDGILDVERHAACSFRHTPLFQNLNFPRKRLADFVDNFTKYGLGLGGPDVFFDSMKDAENALGFSKPNQPKGVYHYYPAVASQIPIGQQVHHENFLYSTRESMLPPPGIPHNLAPDTSVANIYDFSKSQLKPNYMFWFVGNDAYGDALKARLETDGLPLDTGCPSVYGGTCTKL